MWAEEGMDGSGNQENLCSGLDVGVPSLWQAPSSRLHRDEPWPAPSPAHPLFLTRVQGIALLKLSSRRASSGRANFWSTGRWIMLPCSV